MKKVLCFAIIFLSLVSSVFAQNQKYATHEVVLGGQRMNASITINSGGERTTQEICIDRLPCITSVDTPNHATASMGGEIFDIPKGPNVVGQQVYHNMIGQCVSWQLHQNGKRVGYWEVCLNSIGQNNVRTYSESFQIPGSVGSSTTHIQGLMILSQRGTTDGLPFSIRKF